MIMKLKYLSTRVPFIYNSLKSENLYSFFIYCLYDFRKRIHQQDMKINLSRSSPFHSLSSVTLKNV